MNNDNVYIYTLSDNLGNVRYVGKTKYLNKRLKDHLYESKNNKNYKSNWINNLLKANITPILEIIDVVPNDEWVFWEQLFKTWGFKLTNLTIGGNGTGHGIHNINYGKKLTNEHKMKCSIKLRGENNPFYGKKHPPEIMKKFYKSVTQYSLDGEIIKTWNSIIEAETDLKIHSISSACNGKLLSAGGYIWRFTEKNNPQKIIVTKKYRKSVNQYNLDGAFVKKWNSVSEAQKALKISHISKVCNNYLSHKSSGGYIWKYDEDE
jgi:hypothetical protein